MKRKLFVFSTATLKLLAVALISASLVATSSCKKDKDDDDDNTPTETPIPPDSQATDPPTLTDSSLNTVIPNPSFTSNGTRIKMQMTGIKDPATGQYVNITGTGDANQTCWVKVNGTNKGILVTKGTARTKALAADIVFVVDNSGSMGQEADTIAAQIVNWVNYLATQNLSLKVGVVGYDDKVYGALNLTTAQKLGQYLNRPYQTGTYRTVGFSGPDSASLETLASNTGYAGGECGVLAAKFAKDNFNWTQGANRIFVNFTDEPNQPGGPTNAKWSVYDIRDNWPAVAGTIHTVFSEDTTYGYWEDYYDERPWMASIYTGGTYVFVDQYATNLNLNDLPVTGALVNTFTIEYINSESAPYNVQIFVKSGSSDGTRVYNLTSY